MVLMEMENSKVRDAKDERHLSDVFARMFPKGRNDWSFTEGRESQKFVYKDQGLQGISPQVQFQGKYLVRKAWVVTKTE